MRLPASVANDFNEHHMNLVWQELKDRFGFNLIHWKKEFQDRYSGQPRNVTEPEFFLLFGCRTINDVLNNILLRQNGYPTFIRLVEYVMKSR